MSQGLVLGQYRLVRKLATGGMGEVYIAVRGGIGDFAKPMAVKLLLPHLTQNDRAVARFLDEAKISARMSHPNVAQVFDVGFREGRYFIAMELVRGASLSALIKALKSAQKPPSAEVVAWVGRALCDGLTHAHSLTANDEPLNVVHRDVTPHNVLVSTDGAVKLTDFGIARMRDQSANTSPGNVVGKLGYMAPEQLFGEAVDQRADVYGLGATLFHFATLRAPFGDDDTEGATLRALQARRVPDLAELRPDLPPDVVAAIQTAMTDDLGQRFGSARALRDALPDLPGGPEALGELIASSCSRTVEHVDALSRANDEGTPAVDGLTVTPTDSNRGLRRAAWGMVALAVVSLVATAALKWRGGPPPPAQPPPVVVEAEPAPVAATPAPSAPGPERPLETAPEPRREPTTREPARATKKASSEAPDKGIGYLSVTAVPWAYVFVDETRMGETPLAAIPVTAGTHTIRWLNPETNQERTQRITVGVGEKAFARAELR